MSILTDSSVRDFGRIKQTLEMRCSSSFLYMKLQPKFDFFFDCANTRNSGQILQSTR